MCEARVERTFTIVGAGSFAGSGLLVQLLLQPVPGGFGGVGVLESAFVGEFGVVDLMRRKGRCQRRMV